jgi:hypothetical protein
MAQYARDGTVLLDFYHRELSEAVASEFLSHDEAPELRQRLVDYWRSGVHAFIDAGMGCAAVTALVDRRSLLVRLQVDTLGYHPNLLVSEELFRSSRVRLSEDLSAIAKRWPKADPADCAVEALESLANTGFGMLSPTYDTGKRVLISTVEAATGMALRNRAFIPCFQAVLDRIGGYLASPALFEGVQGDFTGWMLYNTARQSFDQVRLRAPRQHQAWFEQWAQRWDTIP